ncbi:Membrane carboxypeptidase (penicillin-binding protein) [Micromonospora phaseoli]|uniref:Membrane carboxypeptidase (Penicillin-binding protein) n=2 Tax=Micromonospora phaseoli TaxID=1144548 RepID=A0A1H7BA89_9ACTN|nr:membrane peptidoglycan carboxypeptidase [Micromonospora phaseoli]SEJ74589.1 Membrane carboxypeptidase (penicillin-binding protein) [Micromonospora phaseoli]
MLIAGFAVFIMLAGIGVVGFTYYSTNVVLPKEIPLPLSTIVYAKDGKTLVAKLGNENRTFVTIDAIPEHVRNAVAAAEDRNFYRHSGVDYKGIARAAWNNLSGGDKQGASTITQQYARNAYENLQDDSYARKVKEAILASKLNDEFTKEEIMENYLNVIYFGRGAYGIEAAAQTYFNTTAKKLNPAQGAVLAALIKQPVASATHPGFDPETNEVDAKSRWEYVINGMVEEGWLGVPGKPERPAEYPKVQKSKKDNGFGVASPRGNVINYVRKEMEEWGLCSNSGAPDKPNCVNELREGGYRITTTLDPKIQKSLEEIAQLGRKDTFLADQPKNLMPAVVSVEAKTGRVLAYYGGNSGADFDYAGLNTDQNGNLVGGHPPGSSFKVYTLAAAIDAGISVKSRWDATPFKPEGFEKEIVNAGRDVRQSCNKSCTLQETTVLSYNVPFFHIAEQIGTDKVIDMARRAGVRTMWDDKGRAHDLIKNKPEKLAPTYFDRVAAYGQYPITVLDHVNGLATLANSGKYNKAHFVRTVEKQNKATGKWDKVTGTGEKLDPKQVIKPEVADEVTAVLKEIPGKNNASLANSRQVAGKTGTWQLGDTGKNQDAWMVGYDKNVATAVWIGSHDTKKRAIVDRGGSNIGGGTLPAQLWKRYMDEALKGYDPSDLPDVAGIGDEEAGNGEAPPPPPPPDVQQCEPTDILCQLGGGNRNGGNNGGDNNGGDNNGPGNPDNGLPFSPPDNGGGGGGLLPPRATNRE